MIRSLFFVLLLLAGLVLPAQQRLQLPNGWFLSPAGSSLPLGDFPMNLALAPGGRYLAAANNGVSRHSIQVIDLAENKQVSDFQLPKAWYGLAFHPDGKSLYASGGNDNCIYGFSFAQGSLQLRDSISLGQPWPHRISPAGLAVHPQGRELCVVTKDDSALYVINLADKSARKVLNLGAEAFACLFSPDGKMLYITRWGGRSVLALHTADYTKAFEIEVEKNPNEMALSANGRYLFVANACDNSVSVLDLRRRKVLETLNAALYPDAPTGSTSNGLALSPDGATLYVSNADNNCLALFDVRRPGDSRPLGFIPTGWYPTALRCTGKEILVANGKGFSSFANPNGPYPTRSAEEAARHRRDGTDQYIGSLMKGSLSRIAAPDAAQLAAWTKAVYENTPYTKERETSAEGEAGNPIPRELGGPSPIKYVFYIVKENRTYDQVLGDMPEGNGDSTLCLFPERITPNQHALAREFVLLDNFYVNAEVSADGHNWSMAAYATDYTEKTWPTLYSRRGGNYDYEGGGRTIAYPRDGYIWDHCARAGISFRSYGEFVDNGKANLPVLEGHFPPQYPGYDLTIQDIRREEIWERDFDSLLAAGALPRFSTVRFGNDHTSGLRKGAYSPFAAVADNDLAVGRFVEHLSHSPIWKESAVFILEDDAQNGPDHVDAHRSIAFVASPYTRRQFVDHTLYTTASMLRTMELILGMPPMSQYDAAATPMWRCFTAEADLRPFDARPAQVELGERNVADNSSSRRSAAFNLAEADADHDLEFNEVLWKAVRGESSEMPAPRRGAFLRAIPEKEAGK
jgi:DNA-binding beta-propeller fold protein YncE